MATSIVLLSGGMDSAAALYWALTRDYRVRALTFNYPSRPLQELKATRRIANYAGVDCVEVELPFLHTATSIREEVPGAFKGVRTSEGYVPTRNLIFYASANYYAEIYLADHIIGGHVKTDREGFADATPTFFHNLEGLLNSLKRRGESRIRLTTPFIQKTKSQVVEEAIELGTPLQLTWSCFYDLEEPCGECESCIERAKALKKAGLMEFSTRVK